VDQKCLFQLKALKCFSIWFILERNAIYNFASFCW